MGPTEYTPANAVALTDLVLSRLPIHFPHVDQSSRDDWEVTAAAMLVRASTATRALFKLSPEDSYLAAEAITRAIIELTITFAWLAASPATNLPEWIGGNDAERLAADNRVKIWLVEGKYRTATEDSVLTEHGRALVEAEAGTLRGLADRAKAADAEWRPRIPELQPANCSFADIYAWAYSYYSWSTHALLQPLFRYVGPHPNGGVFVGDEGKERPSSPWASGLLFYGLSLLVSAEAFGWPDPAEVRALVPNRT